MKRHLITAAALVLALTACGQSGEPQAAQSPSPKTTVASASATTETPTSATTTPPIPNRSPPPENAPAQLDTSGAVWSTMGQDTSVLDTYGIIEDAYYPLIGQPEQFCAVSDPSICTDAYTRLAVMDELLADTMSEPEAPGPEPTPWASGQ